MFQQSGGNQGQFVPQGAFKKNPGNGYVGGATRQGMYGSPGKSPRSRKQNTGSPNLKGGNNGLRGSGAKFYK